MIRLYSEGVGDGIDSRTCLIGEYTTNDIVSIDVCVNELTHEWIVVTFVDGTKKRCSKITIY